ncbi:MAG: hypothetical protein WCW02_01310 [Candidatus Buchananbacteria bacterium]
MSTPNIENSSTEMMQCIHCHGTGECGCDYCTTTAQQSLGREIVADGLPVECVFCSGKGQLPKIS